jgi:hypothetical protein
MNLQVLLDDVTAALEGVGVYVARNRNANVAGFPAAVLSVDQITPAAWGGENDIAMTVTVLASRADRVDAWDQMWQLLDDNVIIDALHHADCVAGVVNIDNIGADVEFNDGVALGFTVAITATC